MSAFIFYVMNFGGRLSRDHCKARKEVSVFAVVSGLLPLYNF